MATLFIIPFEKNKSREKGWLTSVECIIFSTRLFSSLSMKLLFGEHVYGQPNHQLLSTNECRSVLLTCLFLNEQPGTVGPLYLLVLHLQIQPTASRKHLEKHSECFKKQNLSLMHTNCLHSFYIVFTTIYIAFTLY